MPGQDPARIGGHRNTNRPVQLRGVTLATLCPTGICRDWRCRTKRSVVGAVIDTSAPGAESAFDASLEAYRQGVGTYVDVVNAQRNVTAARSVVVDTRSAIFTSAAALALSVGDLAKPSPSSASPPQRQ